MIIDFHTHIFPEKIAERALAQLAATVHLEPGTNGRAEGLQASMRQAGIDLSVVLPIVTNIKQFDSILRFASFLNETYTSEDEPRILSFASIHPDDPDMKERLFLIKQEGFRGIKIHPNYQDVEFNDIRMKRLLYAISELGLPAIIHSGYDPYTPDHDYCTPDMILEVMSDVRPEKLILAHMGSNFNFDESENKLCGLDFYMDTAFSITHIQESQFIRMVRKHGTDKVLFATDSPWADQKKCVDILKGFALTDQEKEMIFCKNAQQLLAL